MAGIVGAVIGIPFALAADHAGSSIAWVIRAIGGSLGSVLTTPFSLLALILLYFDLRVRKEGLTLERLSHEVTGGPPS